MARRSKKKKKGKSGSLDKVESRHEEVYDLARELIEEGVKDEKEVAEAIKKAMNEDKSYSRRHIRYELLRKKAPDDIKEKLGLKKKEMKEKKRPENRETKKREEGDIKKLPYTGGDKVLIRSK